MILLKNFKIKFSKTLKKITIRFIWNGDSLLLYDLSTLGPVDLTQKITWHIQQHYKLQSPFYFKKPKVHRKKASEQTDETVKPKKANKKIGGGNYDFKETFEKTVESLKK